MRKKTLLIFLYFQFVFCLSAVPNWFLNLEEEYPSKDYIRAVGEGISEDAAKKMAIAEISLFFSGVIEAKTYAHNSLVQEDSEYKSNYLIDQNITVLTSSEIFAVQYESWHNRKEKKYYVCVYINKNTAFDVISQELSSFEQGLYYKAQLVKEENEDFRKMLILNNALSDENKIKELYKYLLVVDSQKAKRFEDFISLYNDSKNSLYELTLKNPVSVCSTGDYSEYIKYMISKILKEKGFIISENADYKIITTSSFNITEQHDFFKCQPSISILLEGKKGMISSSDLYAEDFLSDNKQTLVLKAQFLIEELLKENLIQNLQK